MVSAVLHVLNVLLTSVWYRLVYFIQQGQICGQSVYRTHILVQCWCFVSFTCWLSWLIHLLKKEPPPEKKVSHKPSKNKQYGGPGSFVPSGEASPTQVLSSKITSASVLHSQSRQSSDVIPSSLRASSSLAGLDLYVPPYERSRHPHMDTLVQEFNEFGVSEHHRESVPVSISSFSFATLIK